MADETPTPETPAEGDQDPQPQGTTEPTTETPDAKSDELPESVKQVLAKERKAARDAEKARKAAEAKIKEYEDASKSEQEKLAERLSETETRAAEAEKKLARHEVAAAKKLPADLIDLLEGDRDEMEAKADRLLAHVKTEQTPDFGGGPRSEPAVKKAPDQEHNDFLLGILGRAPAE